MIRHLLLLSNSQTHGRAYLEHAAGELADLLGETRRVLFVPFALQDRAGYGEKVAASLAPLGIEARTLTEDDAGVGEVESAEAIFVGGGNTFRLLHALRRSGLLDALRTRVLGGMPYIGSSAGTNIAAPTIRTTNDMPIVQPDSFEALGAIPFQINPHYVDADPASTHMGETREQRLQEYLEENEVPVVGLREGAWLRVDGDTARLGGLTAARIFRREHEPEERAPGADLSDLL